MTPHATPAALGHAGQHEPIASHVLPAAHIVPVPGQWWLPMHVAGSDMPHAMVAGATQLLVHVHAPATHVSPAVEHGPMQCPPQPSSSPHIDVAVHVGTH